ncbi:hypothetical protein [Paenibacillus bovis]|uniref:Uncharacterized protein n=1 Tax=Paenibacillus bovis TaxID=1616788 RepID=A0A172ZGP4_9BACL|nr:hypothetical protein [Paenibacillus bovis]ANF96709.1 hypothetical protein AR543_12280 [Paenibacillus bovis]
MSFLYFFWGFLVQWLLRMVTGGLRSAELVSGWVDTIPLIIGYIIMIIGFVRIQRFHPVMGKGKWGAAVLILLSLIQIVLPVTPATAFWGSLLTLPVAAAQLYMVYYLCLGIRQMAEQQLQPNLQQSAYRRWRLYFYCEVTLVLSFICSLLTDTEQTNLWATVSAILAIIYVVLNLVVYLLMLFLTWKAHKQLELPSAQSQQ